MINEGNTLVGGRYQLIHLLGRGGMAAVYKAYQPSLDRHVAIKFLRPDFFPNPTFRDRFRQEARHIAALNHPNIIQVHDFDDSSESCYIVMELIEGESLQSYLDTLATPGQRVPVPNAIQLIARIGEALAYAHQRQLIHRDIKPANVMLAADGRVVLMDFGLARLVNAPHLTVEGVVTGTPDYMAPEQILGKPLDNRTDLYALGVLMYRLITGRLPFEAENELGILFQHVQTMPPLPRLFVPELAVQFEYIILKLLAKEPADRYQTIEALLADLASPGDIPLQVSPPAPAIAKDYPHNLPVPPTSFIPRDVELAAVASRLHEPLVRLLTLTGTGGTGKTRLSLEAAAQMRPFFPDGVFFVNLAPLQTPALLPAAIARTIGMTEHGDQPLAQELLAHLAGRQMLLVLDNFEHILEAAVFVGELLAASPNVKILATSREPLRIYGEHLYQVPPLALPNMRHLPTAEELAAFPAIQMFVARGQAANADFALTAANSHEIAELCIRLDGLPLAIELAAAQLYDFTTSQLVAQLADRLALLSEGPRDRAARQRTMRGAIEWSYSLLSPAEQQLFNQTGIFVGRFSLEAAAAVIGTSDLAPLVRKSLLRQEEDAAGNTYFRLLELLRDYALERLAAEQAIAQLRQKHAAYYLSLAERAELHLVTPQQAVWFQQLEEAHDNFRAVLDANVQEAGTETALRLVGFIWRLWLVRSHLSEGSQWLEQVLAGSQGQPAELRAKALFGAGRLAFFQGNRERSRTFLEESLLLYRGLSDQQGQGAALNSLGEIALQEENYEQAGFLLHEALGLCRANHDPVGIVQSLNILGRMAFEREDYEQAKAFLQESLLAQRELGRLEAAAITLNGLGEIARIQEEYDAANAYYQEALAIYEQLDYEMGRALVLHNLGQVKLRQEKYREAAVFFRSSLGLLKTMEEKVYIAWSLAGLGQTALNLGELVEAVRLLSAAEKLLQETGGQLDTIDRVPYEQCLNQSRTSLDTAEWKKAWLEGQAMPLENLLAPITFVTRVLTPDLRDS
jgi:predicted ATPase/serine/threonine protein kinase